MITLPVSMQRVSTSSVSSDEFGAHWTTTPWRRWSTPSLRRAWTTAMQFLPGRRSPQLTLYSVYWMQQLVSSQTLTSTTVACRVYFTTSCTGLTSRSEWSASLLLWFAGVWRTKLRRIWATTAFRSPPSAADTYVQSTSINWLYRAVGELHSASRLFLLQARWSGTHYRLSITICLTVLAFFGALLRRYYSRDINASSAIEMYPWYCTI